MHYYYYCENYYYSCGNYFGYGYDFYVEGYQIDTTSTSRATRPTPQHNTHTQHNQNTRERNTKRREARKRSTRGNRECGATTREKQILGAQRTMGHGEGNESNENERARGALLAGAKHA